MYKIYKYTNLINNKIYIGQTKHSLEERALNGSNYKSCTYFYSAIQKYGWENFKPEILMDGIGTIEETNYWEDYFILTLDSINPDVGYNLNRGGNNKNTSEVSRRIISEKAKERYKDKTKNPMYGKTHSKETKEKISKTKIGELNPMYGKHHTEEAKEKISNSRIGELNPMHKKEFTQEERDAASEKFKEIAKRWSKGVYCIEDDLLFESIVSAAKYYDVDKTTMSGHLRGKQKTCKGKHFKFVD